MKKKFKIDVFAILAFLAAGVLVAFLIMGILAFSDPLSFLPEKMTKKHAMIVAQDPYFFIGTFSNRMIFTFGIVALGLYLLLAIDLIIRNKASHILLVELTNFVLIAFYIIRSICCFQKGGLQISGAYFNIGAAICFSAMAIYYPLKALDGDCRRGYFAFWIVGLVLALFGSVSSYNLLDFHSNQGDIVYWGGVCCTRLMYLLSCLITAINFQKDFDPDPLNLEHMQNKSDKVLGK
ncbi:MAG: hypothetical protein SPL02_00705 [Bacilli bacterium]|nr:hypothetical protein [Bacilli bacterium]MDY6430354.1 hypothetical protein [Bacilli bacterium]